MDIPQEQYRSLILPGDPIPIENPRPSPDVTPPAISPQQPLGRSVVYQIPRPTDPYNQGFTPFNLGGVPPPLTPWDGAQGTPQVGGYPPGFPTTKAAVLAALAAVSGIPTPAQVIDRSITFSGASTTQDLLGTQPARGWVAMFSPTGPMSGFSTGTAILGTPTTLMFGPGMAWFWSTTQGLGQVYLGAITAVGLVAGMPLWAWESGGSVRWLTDEFGNLITDGQGQAIPLV